VSEIADARPSSSVVLVRDGDSVPELFLVRRHVNSAFGDAYVFPGGVVDATDNAVRECCVGLDSAQANQLLHIDAGGIDYYIAAIRELFEETGVLLAEHRLRSDELNTIRDHLNSNELEWNRFIEESGVQLCSGELHYFSHWITPDVMPKRYTTRFFIARCPADQDATHVDGELTDARWISAGDALAAGESGDMRLYFPTIKTLQRLARHHSVDALIAWADEVAHEGVAAIQPVIAAGKPQILDRKQSPK